MENYLQLLEGKNKEILMSSSFFFGLSEDEVTRFICFSKPQLFELDPGQTVSLQPGSKRRLGAVLEGNVKVYTIDYDGNKTIVNVIRGRSSVGTMQFMMEYHNVLFEITADSPSKIISIDPDTLLVADEALAMIQHKILVNVMASQRQLFISISEHLMCLSQKTIRDKIMRFLKICSESTRSYTFDIPMSREQLAEFLAVDRASLSRSLSGLKSEGIIDFNKNHFTILTTRYFQY